MKNNNKLRQPESYNLSQQDIEQIDDFDNLLTHLTEISNSEPLHNISINSIGVDKQKAMLSIENIDEPGKYVPVLCEINTGVDLWENRGIHMSRCIQDIFTLAQHQFKSLDEFTYKLANIVRENQASETAFAEVTGTYIHKRHTKKTKLESYDNIQLISKAVSSKKKTHLKIGVKAHHVTACPCTRAYTKYSIVPELKTLGLTLDQIQKILDIVTTGTHMQLGTTMLIIDKNNDNITYKEIYDVLEKSLHLVYELLKRPDEHDLVMRSLKKPQFAEDAVREVAFNTYQMFQHRLSVDSELSIESILHDSIHIHDVKTIIQKNFGEIGKELSIK